MFQAYLCQKSVRGQYDELLKLEQRTGVKPSDTGRPCAEGDYTELSTTAAVVSSLLAANATRIKYTFSLVASIQKCLNSSEKSESGAGTFHGNKSLDPLDFLLRDCQHRLKMIEFESEQYEKRIDGQIAAVSKQAFYTKLSLKDIFNMQISHLLARDDFKATRETTEHTTSLTEASLTIARETKRDAEASFILAQETKRDADAMKTLAVVTMVFLPGTAVATIFAMPFFDWNHDKGSNLVNVSGNFWIYWVTTIPLTIATLSVWRLWIYLKPSVLYRYEDVPIPNAPGYPGLNSDKDVKVGALA